MSRDPQASLRAKCGEAVKTWLSIEDDPEVLAEEVDLELQEVENNFNGIEVDDGKLGEEEDDGVRPDSCITTSITEAEVRSRLEDVRSYLHAEGRNGEYSESLYLLSKTVHSFTHKSQVKRRAKGGVRCSPPFAMHGSRSLVNSSFFFCGCVWSVFISFCFAR